LLEQRLLAKAGELRQVFGVTLEAIREARDATPFRPFVIRTADGHDFTVPNHDSLLLAEQGKTLIVVTADQRFHILATELVSSISR
jgi:hypothetical protein